MKNSCKLLTIRQATKNILSRLRFEVYPATIITIISLLAIVPCTLFLPKQFAWENSVIENSQLVILSIAFILAIRIPFNKPLFNWIAMIVAILFLREINCGRIFFKIPGSDNSFYSWDQIPYGLYVRYSYVAFILWTIFYFLKNKLWREIITYAKDGLFPFWDWTLLIIGIILGTVGEEIAHDELFEEVSEVVFYLALLSVIYIYGYKEKFKLVVKI